MSKRRGGCLCGAVRYEFADKPRVGLSCFCRDCQYVSGGAPAHALIVARQDLTVTGVVKTYWTEAESGRRVAREFCATCGTPLFAYTAKKPGRLALKVGSLDNPSDFAPQLAIWMSSAQPWHTLDISLPRFQGLIKLARIIRPDAARDRVV